MGYVYEIKLLGTRRIERYFRRMARNAPNVISNAGKIVGFRYADRLKKAVERGSLLTGPARQLTEVRKRYKKRKLGGGRGTNIPYSFAAKAIRYWWDDGSGSLYIGWLDKGPQKCSASWQWIVRNMQNPKPIDVTDPIRRWFYTYGKPDYVLYPHTDVLEPPDRPVIKPFLAAQEQSMRIDFRNAFFAKLRGQRV